MTREEALKWFKDHTIIDDTKDGEAHEWAIKALSEQTICHIENNTKESDLVYRPSADDTFCKSQLITCNRVKECNGVCPFEDALKHADKTQTMNDQHTVDHDRNWIIGCIEHDGFIKTDRFDKANQIILDALSAEAVQGEWGHMIAHGTDGSHWYEYECSHCGEVVLRPYNFCPNCGTMMYKDGDDTTGESL